MKTRFMSGLATALLCMAAVIPARAQTNFSDRIFAPQLGIDISIPESTNQFLPAFAGPFPNVPDQAIVFYEPGPAGTNYVPSDAIWIQAGHLYFESDVNNQLTFLPAAIPVIHAPVVEDGTLQDVGQYFQGAGGVPLFGPNVLYVQSDVEVPEPSSIALLVLGGIAVCLRRRSTYLH
jgi:hypothetical protein